MPRTPACTTPASRRRRLLRAATAVSLGGALAVGGGAALAPSVAVSTAAAPARAAALDGAAKGGAVIVWLKDQHANLNLRTQGRQRTAAAHADQAPIVADIRAHGGIGITQLVSVNAIAARLSASEVARLRTDAAVKQIVPDSSVAMQTGDNPSVVAAARATATADDPGFPTAAQCPTDPTKPLLEPEALTDLHASSDDPNAPDMANSIATGKGVVVAISGMNNLAGNPNFQRPDGSHVVIDAPDYTKDASNDEAYGDASSVAAQGTVVYDMSKALPFSGLPTGCTFVIKGDAPDASLVDSSQIDTPPSPNNSQATESTAQVIAGIDNAVVTDHADIISESYGGAEARVPTVIHTANDAAVAAGVTVVVSAGDSGNSGTVNPISADPLVIASAAVDNFRLVADAHGYTGWVSNNLAGISGGGTAPTNKMPDLSAPGYFGEAACALGKGGCPSTYPTEAFRGTSEAAPLIAGGAADVIQAYRDSHGGASPSPALVKQVLVSTATDIDAPAEQQGGGLMNIYAAVKAAQQLPGTTVSAGPGDAPGLVVSTSSPDGSQLALTGAGGTDVATSADVYNTSDAPTTVTGTYRAIGSETQLGNTVTEAVSAPAAGTPIPAEGATAAAPVTFTVPTGLDRLDAKMIWPDPTNDNVLCFALFDPEGRLAQLTYDDGSAGRNGAVGSVPDIQDGQVSHPEAGTWTARFLWSGADVDLAVAPATPGTYTGPMSFEVSGANWVTSPASDPVTIAAHSQATIPLSVALPQAPGDHPESVQFSAGNGATASVPVARRTVIPNAGGDFQAVITSSVGRAIGQVNTYKFNVAAGRPSLSVAFHTPDASADNKFTFFLIDPTGAVAAKDTTPKTTNGVSTNATTLTAANPMAGQWEIDIELTLTTSGKEFTQTVFGDVVPDVPVISSPADGAISGSKTPTISGTGVPGDTITVTDEAGDPVCTATVAADGSWTCTASPLAAGPHTLTATQTDPDGNASVASSPVHLTVAFGTATETITTTVTQQGGLTISVPDTSPVVLPTPVLNGDATALTSSAAMHPVTVTDTRTQSPGWNVLGQVSDFTNATDATIAAADLGWAPMLVDEDTGQTVTPGPAVTPGADGGLGTARQLASAPAGAANGTAHLSATLNLQAPTTTQLGSYTATMTLTAI